VTTLEEKVGSWCYHRVMPVRKLSVAIDEEVAAAATAAAARHGMSLSAWLTKAASNALAIEEGLAAVAAWEASMEP
jgi:hypothetical protein